MSKENIKKIKYIDITPSLAEMQAGKKLKKDKKLFINMKNC